MESTSETFGSLPFTMSMYPMTFSLSNNDTDK